MRFDKNLSAIHGYLCGDGYVIKNPKTQKHKYYHIGFRNTNEVLLKDFQKRFHDVFRLIPYITNDGRCRIQNKEIYFQLTKNYSYYSYEWELPNLSKSNLKCWLRAFFDCEAWVVNQPRKSRVISLDCCNEKGLLSVQESLRFLGIESHIKRRKDRTIWRLTICGKGNLIKFNRSVGFLHPQKNQKLKEALSSYVNYNWQIPKNRDELISFINEKGRVRESRGEIRLFSINQKNLVNLRKVLNKYGVSSKLFGPWKNNWGSKYYCLILRGMEEQIHEGKNNRSSFSDQKDY